MNPMLESAFPTEDLYCTVHGECEDRNSIIVILLSSEELFELLRTSAQQSREIGVSIKNALKDTSASGWNDYIGPFVNKPGTVPAGLAAGDAYALSVAARAVYTGVPAHVTLTQKDLPIIKRILQRLGGFATKIELRTNAKGVQYIVVKGYAGLRPLLNASYFRANNPRILQLGLGIQGLKHTAKGSFVTAMVVGTTVEVCNWYFNDKATVADLAGGVFVETVKTGIGLGFATLAGSAAMGGATFIGILPLGVFIIASFAAGFLLNWLDSEFQLKQKVQTGLNIVQTSLEEGWYRLEAGVLERLEGRSQAPSATPVY